MANEGSLNIVLSATAEAFNAGLKKAEHGLSALAEKASHLKEALTSPFAELAGVAAGGGMAMMLHQTMEQIEAADRLGRTLGITTQEMQRLQYAAESSHVGTESLATGLQKMEKTLGEAMLKGGEAAQVFDELGLDLKRLANESASQAFAEISDGLAHVEVTSRRAALTVGVFGRSGMELIPMLERGSAGLRDAAAAADRTHYALNGIELARVEQAEEAIKKLRLQLEGAARLLTAKLSPYIAEIADFARTHMAAARAVMASAGALAGLAVVVPIATNVVSSLTSVVRTLVSMPPLELAAAGAMGLFAAVVARSAATNESWAASSYHVLRGLGLFHYGTQDLSVAMEDYGAAAQKVFSIQGELDHAKDSSAQLDAQRDMVAALHDRLALAKRIVEEEAKTHSDVGIGDKQVKQIEQQLSAAQKALEQLETEKVHHQFQGIADDMDEFAKKAKAAAAAMKSPVEQLAEILAQAQEKLAMAQAGPEHAELAKGYEAYAEAVAQAQEKIRKSAFGANVVERERAALAELKNQLNEIGAMEEMQHAAENFNKAAEAIKKLQDEVDTFGMSEAQKQAHQFEQQKGVTPEQISQLKALAEQRDRLEDVKKANQQMQEDAQKLWADTRTEAEKYQNELDKIEALLAAGMIDQDMYQRGLKKAADDFHKASDKDQRDDKKVAAEEVTAAYIIPADSGANDPLEKVVDVGRQQLTKTDQQNDILRNGFAGLGDKLNFGVVSF